MIFGWGTPTSVVSLSQHNPPEFEDVADNEEEQLNEEQEYSLEASQSDSFDSDFEETMDAKIENEETNDTASKKRLRGRQKFVEEEKSKKPKFKFFKPDPSAKQKAVRRRTRRMKKSRHTSDTEN